MDLDVLILRLRKEKLKAAQIFTLDLEFVRKRAAHHYSKMQNETFKPFKNLAIQPTIAKSFIFQRYFIESFKGQIYAERVFHDKESNLSIALRPWPSKKTAFGKK